MGPKVLSDTQVLCLSIQGKLYYIYELLLSSHSIELHILSQTIRLTKNALKSIRKNITFFKNLQHTNQSLQSKLVTGLLFSSSLTPILHVMLCQNVPLQAPHGLYCSIYKSSFTTPLQENTCCLKCSTPVLQKSITPHDEESRILLLIPFSGPSQLTYPLLTQNTLPHTQICAHYTLHFKTHEVYLFNSVPAWSISLVSSVPISSKQCISRQLVCLGKQVWLAEDHLLTQDLFFSLPE